MPAVGIDATVLLAALALSLLTALASGLAPFVLWSRADPAEALREAGRGASGGATARRWRAGLVVVEVAIATVVSVGAGLLFESYARLGRVELGFRPEGLVRVGLPAGRDRFRQPQEQAEFCRRMLGRAARLEGIEAVALCNLLVVNPWTSGAPLEIDGAAEREPGRAPLGIERIVSPEYFRTFQIPLVAGRGLTERDGPGGPHAAVVSRAFAQAAFPDQDPVGRRIRFRSSPWLTIVGVAGDVRHPMRDEPRPVVYRSHLQSPPPWLYLVARTSMDAKRQLARLREVLRAVDPEQPMGEPGTVEDSLDAVVSEPRFNLVLIGVFAAVALALALAGIHGLVAYSVGQRTQEIGIRMALGARGRDVVALVAAGGARLALAGVAAGSAAAWWLSRALASAVYGIAPTRPWAFAAAAAFLVAVSVAASILTARRATRIDPMAALRSE